MVKNSLFLILEPSGIFVKSITKSSAVEHDGRIQIGDQIIAVSYTFNTGFCNSQELCSLGLERWFGV